MASAAARNAGAESLPMLVPKAFGIEAMIAAVLRLRDVNVIAVAW
jgi:hypothetical protein